LLDPSDIGTGFVIGLAVGGAIGWLALRVRLAPQLARLTADLESERRAATEKLAAFAEAGRQLRESFDALSRQALDQNSRSFVELAKAHLGQFQVQAQADLDGRKAAIDRLVQPLRDTVEAVSRTLSSIQQQHVSSHSALTTQLQVIVDSERALRDETRGLKNALHMPVVRGRWGEIQLRRVVELAGMVAHCDFQEQATTTTTDGARLRPDVVVRLPGGKVIVIDAKAPLSAYLDAAEAQDDERRRALLKDHARQVREHLRALGARGYQEQISPTPEFVVMFLPGESFFSAALQGDPTLIEAGVDEKVIPASPTTLIALLRAVAYGWQQEALAENAAQIANEGRALYERIRIFADHFEEVRKGLEQAIDGHNRAVGSFEGRLIVTARRLRDLNAATDREIPELRPVETVVRRPTLPDPEEPDRSTASG